MKLLVAATLIIGLTFNTIAQGYLSIHLGSDSGHVSDFLWQRNAEILFISRDFVYSTYGNLEALYAFEHGKLVSIETQKIFRNRRAAKETFEKFLEAFNGAYSTISHEKKNRELELTAVSVSELNNVRVAKSEGKFIVEHKIMLLAEIAKSVERPYNDTRLLAIAN